MKLADVALLAAVALLALSFTSASHLQLPSETVAKMSDAEWTVEVFSPCHATSFGHAFFAKDSQAAVIVWLTGGANTTLSGAAEGEPLDLSALAPHALRSGDRLQARVCDALANNLTTVHRPGVSSKATSTHHTLLTGAVGSKKTQCGASADPSFFLQTVEVPTGKKDALQAHYIELSIDPAALDKSCLPTAAAAAAGHTEPRRKRRAHSATAAEGPGRAEAQMTQLTTVRLVRQKPEPKSFLQQFYPSLLIMAVFVVLRVVSSRLPFGK